MAKRFRRRQAPVAGAHDHVDQRVAGLVEQSSSSRRSTPGDNVDIDVLAYMVRSVFGLPLILITGTIGLPITLPCPVGKVWTT